MSIPLGEADVPARVRALADGAILTPVWENGMGGLTFRTGDDRFIRFGRRNAESSMRGEADRLEWAAAFVAVPRVLEHGSDHTHEWLVTEALPGRSAVDPHWLADAAVAVDAVGRGLRMLHDRLPVSTCPFDWGLQLRVTNAEGRGIRLAAHLRTAPPVDLLVVCHGDACCPNTLVDDEGRCSGHVDLGALGVADRWADIAVASMSTRWNYGPGWDGALIEAYGITPDRERLAYYRALWNAT